MTDERERRVKWQALKTAAAEGMEDDLSRAAIGWAKANGYVHGPSLVAGAAAQRAPAAAASGGAVLVFPPYGRSKGMPIKGASMQDLDFYANGCRRTLADDSKARWHDKERALLAAIEAEMAREEAF